MERQDKTQERLLNLNNFYIQIINVLIDYPYALEIFSSFGVSINELINYINIYNAYLSHAAASSNVELINLYNTDDTLSDTPLPFSYLTGVERLEQDYKILPNWTGISDRAESTVFQYCIARLYLILESNYGLQSIVNNREPRNKSDLVIQGTSEPINKLMAINAAIEDLVFPIRRQVAFSTLARMLATENAEVSKQIFGSGLKYADKDFQRELDIARAQNQNNPLLTASGQVRKLRSVLYLDSLVSPLDFYSVDSMRGVDWSSPNFFLKSQELLKNFHQFLFEYPIE